MKEITLIAPYSGISDLAANLQGDYPTIHLATGELNHGLLLAEEAIKQGTQVIISRGGTAKLLQQKTDTPIVEIKVSGFDLLRSIQQARVLSDRIAVIGYENVIKGAQVIAKILKLEINYYILSTEDEITNCIAMAKLEGVEVVIGDSLSYRHAVDHGLKGILITSGIESIHAAIEEAFQLYELTKRETLEKNRYLTILESVIEGIIAIDEEGKILIFNDAAEKIFDIDAKEALGKNITHIFPQSKILNVLTTGTKSLDSIETFEDKVIAINRTPIFMKDTIMGAVATFRDITKIQDLEVKFRQSILNKGLVAKRHFHDIHTHSPLLQEVIKKAKLFAKTDSTVLICGESGTGKELFAQSIHNASDRRDKPFVAINCAALPPTLLESELFGYIEGAFTGARKGGKKGVFELAHTGTIFLDEISEMDMNVQSRILRIIQEREIMRLGDDQVIPIDVRIITATNKELLPLVFSGDFRNDLFYRLNVLNINIPPLSKRKMDVPILASFYLEKFSKRYQQSHLAFSDHDLKTLMDHTWPGNVRELQNVIERFVITQEIIIDYYQPAQRDQQTTLSLEGSLEDIKLAVIEQVLVQEEYHKSNTAKRLGISRATLDRYVSK